MRRCGTTATGTTAIGTGPASGPVPGSILDDCLAAHDSARRVRSQVSIVLSRSRAIRLAADAMLAHGDRPWPESSSLVLGRTRMGGFSIRSA